MKGPKWLQKLNKEELQGQSPPASHYLAGPGKGRVLQEELYWYANRIRLEVLVTDLPSLKGAKFWPRVNSKL